MTFLPTVDVLIAYTLASLLLIITPGPDMTLFLGQTLAGGRARGLASMLGACTGLLMHTMLAVFGLSALLAASTTAFTVLKVAGVAYLLWLAVQALRHGTALNLSNETSAPRPLSRVFLSAVGVNILNPKIIMFFVTFLPQFVSVSDPHADAKLTFLGLYYIALGLPMCTLMILAADRFTATLRSSRRAMRAFDYIFAGVMGAFAVRLVFARNN
jgi:threonine/homoserine/homoserine lactone efflux protein